MFFPIYCVYIIPAISLPVCLHPYENNEWSLPIDAPAAIPTPPVIPATTFYTIEPYKLGITITSNYAGFLTNCIQQLSIIISSYLINGYFYATSRCAYKNKPSTNFIILALWTAVTFFLPLRWANSNAYSAILNDAYLVVTLIDSTTPGYTSCSTPEYSPSVFSLITTISVLWWRYFIPSTENANVILAYKSKYL